MGKQGKRLWLQKQEIGVKSVTAIVIANKNYTQMFMVCVLVIIVSAIIQPTMERNVYRVNKGVQV